MGCRLKGANVSIEVHDTGPGIPEAQREGIFMEFQRGETSVGDNAGIGLGLSIVRRFATELSHEIHLKSHLGRGSMFGVTVPRSTAPEMHFGPDTALPAFGGMEGAKILLIENDLASAEGLANLLEKWGCDVAIAKSAGDARDSISALDEVPDVIIATSPSTTAKLASKPSRRYATRSRPAFPRSS